jgi:hypothetical protein
MAKARPDRKREKDGGAQPSLPGTPESGAREPTSASAVWILPMQLQVGDRLAEETGEWEVANRPHTTAGGKIAHVRVRRVDQPTVVEDRTWGAHERIEVKRG